MGAKSITVVRAVTADFVFDCRAAEVQMDRKRKKVEAPCYKPEGRGFET
jgi:hypothetical protein